MDELLATEVASGLSVGDIFTIEFLGAILGSVLAAATILVIGFMVARWVQRRITALGERHEKLDNTLFTFLGNIARYAVMAIVFVLVLNNFGIQTTSIVAIIGAAGLAIGLALQGTLSNVAAGVMIIFFRPIKQGDFVEVGGVSGTVKDVSLNFTELAALGNFQIIIPNSQVWGNTIKNYSVYDTRRAEWIFGVGYGANLADAERIIRETIEADPRTMMDPEPFLQVNNLGDFSVDFLVRYWCASSDFFAYQADMKRRVKEALDAGSVPIPFPTRTIINESA